MHLARSRAARSPVVWATVLAFVLAILSPASAAPRPAPAPAREESRPSVITQLGRSVGEVAGLYLALDVGTRGYRIARTGEKKLRTVFDPMRKKLYWKGVAGATLLAGVTRQAVGKVAPGLPKTQEQVQAVFTESAEGLGAELGRHRPRKIDWTALSVSIFGAIAGTLAVTGLGFVTGVAAGFVGSWMADQFLEIYREKWRDDRAPPPEKPGPERESAEAAGPAGPTTCQTGPEADKPARYLALIQALPRDERGRVHDAYRRYLACTEADLRQ